MANYNQSWEDLGQDIQDIIDQAVRSRDFQKLNQSIRQVVDRAVDMGSEVVRNVMDGGSEPKNGEQSSQSKNLPALYGSTGGKKIKGIAKIAGGSVLACTTFAGTLSAAALDAVFGGFSLLTVPGILGLMGFAGGVWMICSGVSTVGMVKRFKSYRKVLGQKTHCTLEKLARSVGKNVKFVRKELGMMIREGYFLEGHLDKEGNCLITSDETFQYFEQSRLQLEQRRHEEAAKKKAAGSRSPQVQEVLDKGNTFIDQIRRCNDAIPGEEISAKIDRMETIVRRIFQRVETNPEIVPDLKKMMDYYLPMTVKLLNAYADMDAQPVQGQTIQSSKREIEDSLDTLNLAFEKLLDSVFMDTAMDVSSDISVLNTLLAQEGLTEDELTKIRNQNV